MLENKDILYPRSDWRLLITPPNQGAVNMAIDEAILEAVGRGEVLPTLRLYSWRPACLSLGYAQSLAEVDITRLTKLGWDIVRRPTGGKAILHADDLTYSVIGPHTEIRLAGSILESYYRLSRALLSALHYLGINAEVRQKSPQVANSNQSSVETNKITPPGPVCFEMPSTYEITMEDKKLIGSAQARRKEGILQHGSVPLYGDLTRITQCLKFSSEEARFIAADRLLKRAATIESTLGKRIDWETAAQTFSRAFQETLNLDFHPSSLTPFEEKRAAELVRTKYAHPSWTQHI